MFWILRGHHHFGPFWSFFIVMGGGMQTRDHLGWSLRSCPQQNGGFEVRFLSAKTCHAFGFPLSWWRRKRGQRIRQPVACVNPMVQSLFSSDVMMWAPNSQWIWRHIILHVCIIQPMLQSFLQTFSQSPKWSLIMFSSDGNTLHVCCMIVHEI